MSNARTTDSSEIAQSAQTARIAATWLKLGKSIDQMSLALMLLALAATLCVDGVLFSRAALLVVIVAGACEKWLALRVALDAAIFADWAASWEKTPAQGSAPEETLLRFDQTLTAIRGQHRVPAARPLADRVRGALALFHRQAALLLVQLAAWLLALLPKFA